MSPHNIPNSINDEARRRWEQTWRDNSPESLPWEESRAVLVLVGLVEGNQVATGAVLDICCSTGANSAYLALRGFEDSGKDISPTAVVYAQDRAQREGIRVGLRSGDTAYLPYPNAAFGFVFDRGCFHSITPADREDDILGLHRVLKTGGRYQFSYFSRRSRNTESPSYGFTPGDIQRLRCSYFRILGLSETISMEGDNQNIFLLAFMEKQDIEKGVAG
ncbi:MAG: class I SAM-dependent methyltransferase [Dehalococcoidia bacterium]|nr:class I SAM-dependent methyltransferase [Dehalococcoidia bacterium]MDP7470463.1 class I SAM-dependent methyltransferase [Dehalococcoidia bacterium]